MWRRAVACGGVTPRQRLLNLAIAAVIAAVAAVVILSTSGEDEGAPAQPAATPTAAADGPVGTTTPRPRRTPEPVPALEVRNGQAVGGVRTIRVDEGERVRFDVTSDVPEEIHVHAYEIYRDLTPGKPTRVAFDADITGIIEVELHGSGEPLAELRIEP